MARPLAVVAVYLVMTACAPPPSAPAGLSGAAATARTSSPTKTTGSKALADGVIPTDCSYVSDAELLGALGVATTGTTISTSASSAPMPTSEAQATEENRVWPGLGCLYPSPDADQEAIILVMPGSSLFFTTRQTTTCLPTYGKGSAVDLGSTKGWFCPTTNETPGEWVSFVHHGRLVTVSRTSAPTGDSPYRNVLVSYAAWLAARI